MLKIDCFEHVLLYYVCLFTLWHLHRFNMLWTLGLALKKFHHHAKVTLRSTKLGVCGMLYTGGRDL